MLKWFIPIALTVILIAWCVVSLIEGPNYMKYVGCPTENYKGLNGTRTWFRVRKLIRLFLNMKKKGNVFFGNFQFYYFASYGWLTSVVRSTDKIP